MARRLFQITTGLLAGGAAVAGAVLLGWLPGGPDAPADPHALSTPFPAPELRLTDHTGAPFTLAGADGATHVTVVFFGFTNCPDVCPVTLDRLGRAVEALGRRGAAVRVVFVTVDPARDTPERLAEYVGGFHPRFTGLTGSEEEVDAATEAWGIHHVVPGGASEYDVEHTARSFVVDREGMVRATFPSYADEGGMARTLRRILARR